MIIMVEPKSSTETTTAPSSDGDNAEENSNGVEKIPSEVLVIAQEVKIVQALASNDLNKRNRQMKKLRIWLQLRTRSSFPFTDEDFMRIWKGLYYNMWMSDKPLVQEELAENMGKLINCFEGDIHLSVKFFAAFLRTMCNEWFGIDQWRIDKFLMLMRRMLRYMFHTLKDKGWAAENVETFNEHMRATVLVSDGGVPIGVIMHFLDIFFEELAKVSEGNITAEEVAVFVRPFVAYISTQQNDYKLASHCRKRVFYHLMYQSALGREYNEKYTAWRLMGFPTKTIDGLEKDEDATSDAAAAAAAAEEKDATQQEETIPMHLDPRAGNVDVFMPELPLDVKYIIEDLENHLLTIESTKTRKTLKKLVEMLEIFQGGQFPLGIKTVPRFEVDEEEKEKPLIQTKIEEFDNLEHQAFGTVRMLKKLNKRKRRKLLKSINYDGIDVETFEKLIEDAIQKKYSERKRKLKTAIVRGWIEEEIDDEENDTTTTNTPNTPTTPTTSNNHALFKEKQANKKNKRKHKHAENGEESPAPMKKVKETTDAISNETADIPENPVAMKQLNGSNDTDAKILPKSATVTSKADTTITSTTEWGTPLKEGEIEYFIPSRKLKMKKANSKLVLNPLANKVAASLSPMHSKLATTTSASSTPVTPGSGKRVKIALKRNTTQAPSEYIRQVKNSPDLPYDANKKPSKGLLKPNAMPTPINPFYKKKIGLKLLTDTV